jgi:hypothetical protein
MATLVAVNPKVVKGAMEIVTRYAAASTVWKAGQILRINSSGALVAISDNATTGGAAYLALTDRATGDAAGYVEVGKITSDLVFEMHVTSGTVSTANIGQSYALSVDSNKVTVDTADTNDPYVTVLELGFNYDPAVNDSSDTLARVRVKFIQSIIDAAPAG